MFRKLLALALRTILNTVFLLCFLTATILFAKYICLLETITNNIDDIENSSNFLSRISEHNQYLHKF